MRPDGEYETMIEAEALRQVGRPLSPEERYRFIKAFEAGWNAAIAHIAALLERERRL